MVVAFDLDGTLYTCENILALSYQVSVEEANRRWATSFRSPSTLEILNFVGQPVRKIFAGLYPDMESGRRDELANDVLADLTRRIRDRGGMLYEGVIETLEALRERGHTLLLVSNCRRSYLEAVLETYALEKYFESTRCNEDDPALGKPGLLRQMVAGRKAVMVGDRASDGEAAQFAGIGWIGCCYGYSQGTEIELKGAVAVIRSLRDILPIMETMK